MADSAASVTSAAPVNAPASATTGDNALDKNPFADTQSSNPSEPAASKVTEPLSVAPDVHKQADKPVAATNGSTAASGDNETGTNGTGSKLESLVPEQSKQAADPTSVASTTAPPTESSAPAGAAAPVLNGADKDVESKTGASAGLADGASASTAGAPSTDAINSKTKDNETTDGVPLGTSTSTAAPGALGSVSTSAEKTDLDMKDATLPEAPEKPAEPAPTLAVGASAGASAPVAAPATDITGLASTTAAPAAVTTGSAVNTANHEEPVNQKRKAEADADGIDETGEPNPKKQKGAIAKAVDKAKDVVDDVKTKATNKGNKKPKKEAAPAVPAGRTERKTRSQGRVE
ncbi:hypothetical protein BD289DRAFT_449016 [Coniella lustricola]|uniref:Uncharacterized protein n=1 Tax=Coniella lustricola TaxID=2025994 RepID=A0A2T3ANE5_9PEZI|nr:hypothetical protein BD289DRAFT_449016 [Coniella lustricola]